MTNLTCATVMLAVCCICAGAARHRPTIYYHYEATANSVDGVTRSGTQARVGAVAADVRLLPLGTRIRIRGAGSYSGVYVVTDTGAKVTGRQIDLYLPTTAEAKQFGRKSITVQIIKWGDWKQGTLPPTTGRETQ